MQGRYLRAPGRFIRFLRFGLWDMDTRGLPAWQAFGLRQLRVAAFFFRGFTQGRVQVRASAMSFTTLLTLGPVLVLALSICQSFGVLKGLESQLESFIFDNLSPGSIEPVRIWIHRFFEGVRSGAFRGLSILVLLGGVVGLLGSIESAFNHIWGVHRGRPLLQRFALYTTLVVFAPVLIGLSISLTASFETATLKAFIAARSPATVDLLRVGFRLVPALFTGIAFTLLYTVVPNVRVRLRSALPAGMVAGVLWEFSKFGYRWYMHRASHYGTIYGSLAAIPLFMVWVYVSWTVVLFGAQLAFARDAAQDFRMEEDAQDASPVARLRVAFHLALAASRNYRDGLDPPEMVTLAHRWHLPLRLVHSVAEELADGGILHLVSLEEREFGLVPARSPDRITTYDVIRSLALRGTPLTTEAGPASTAPSLVDRLMEDIDRTLRDHCGVLSLAEILEEQDRLGHQEVLMFPKLS